MKKKVYFCGSIRGGRDDAQLYQEIISFINQTDIVLTEQVGDTTIAVTETTNDSLIYQKDISMLEECDLVIAECTHPSLGVGYEVAYAEARQKPVYILYRNQETELSAMLKGNAYFKIVPYQDKAQLFGAITTILTKTEKY